LCARTLQGITKVKKTLWRVQYLIKLRRKSAFAHRTIVARSVEVKNLFEVQSQQRSEGKASLERRQEPRIQTS
jgi:hypothetical protein